jgi:AcrR family transcriptional regulator
VVVVKENRRDSIGDGAIAIVARDGLRSLTHRAVDRELGLPDGSTSYYVRTRRQLIEAMVHRLAGRTVTDLRPPPPATTVEGAAERLAGTLEVLARRPDDHRARYALVVDLATDPDLHAYLTHASPIRAGALASASATLAAIGVEDPERHAPGLVALMDGLLFDRVAGSGVDPASRPDATALLSAYLRGLAECPGRSGTPVPGPQDS